MLHRSQSMVSADTDQTQPLIELFNRAFESYHTILKRGDGEPLYLPAQHGKAAQIIFAHGYYASALHEIAHWCQAGEARRMLEDYGYWYHPDGRSADQQAAFEKVEIKPQAIEWGLTLAAGRTFRVSTDNLNGAQPNRAAFQALVHAQALCYLEKGFPPRAQRLIQVLHAHYQTPALSHSSFHYSGMQQ